MLDITQTDAFTRWIAGLRDDKARAKIITRIERLAMGNPGDVSPVGGGVSELRIDYGPGYRVYFMRRSTTVILVLCGGDKRMQAKDIRLAQKMVSELE